MKNFAAFALILLSFLSPISLKAEEQTEARLEFLDIFKKIPQTSKYTFQKSFSKEAIPAWAVIVGSTALTYYYDEKIISWSQKTGRQLGIGNDDNTEAILKIGGHDIIRAPTDTGSFLYFLGDGWMHFAIAGSILGTGYATDSNYEVNTGLMILHGMVVSTIFNQTLKRSFGRESPNVKTHERGLWRPFPSFNTYNSETASYDAMPSGHIMTATLTFTILAERYPEYQVPLYSVGAVWLTALGFQMANNAVHWVSDYPLGIAMGWVVGKAATRMVPDKNLTPEQKEVSWNFTPVPSTSGMAFKAFKQF